MPAGIGSSNSSSSFGPSIPQLEQAQTGLRLLLNAAVNISSSSGSGGGGGAAAAALDAGAKQLQAPGMIQLLAFCIFEVLIGMFWPSMMTLRAKYVPEQQRSTIINVFRIPLNLFVCLILWKVGAQGALLLQGAVRGQAAITSHGPLLKNLFCRL